METLTFSTLRTLLDPPGRPCVSIVVPVAHGAYDQHEARLDLKNLVATARRDVHSQLRPHQTNALLAPAEELLDEASPWPHVGGSIGLFLAPGRSVIFHIPMVVPPRVMVGERFEIAPLLPVVLPDCEFHVLALSRNELKLFRATRYTMEQLHLHDLPKSLIDALWYEHHENELTSHGGMRKGNSSQSAGVLHGGPAWPDERREMYSRYFQHIDRVLEPELFAAGAPMVLAAVEREISGYRTISHHPRLCAHAVVGNPEDLSETELHAAAWEVVLSELRADRRSSLDRFDSLTGSPRHCVDVNEILDAATSGRVDSLFVPETVGEQQSEPFVAGDADQLVNLAVIGTLAHRGEVVLVPPSSLPDGASMAAVLRWSEQP